MKSNYELVLEVIENYEMENVLNDFKDRFVEGENISRKDYNEFCFKYVSDCSEGFYINWNWRYIESGGDESVFNYEDINDYNFKED